MGAHIDMWQLKAYYPRDMIDPDTMVVCILQNCADGTITEKAQKISLLGTLLESVKRLQKNNSDYKIIAIHSYKARTNDEI